MTTAERLLDIGGLVFPPHEEESLFFVAAKRHPGTSYTICDLRAPRPEFVRPPNLTIDTPVARNAIITKYYKLPYPSWHFMSARMDMVLDYLLDPILHFQVMREIHRVLMPNGSFSVVDVEANRDRCMLMTRFAGFQRPIISEHSELLTSGYPISVQSESFVAAGARLFLMTAQKS